MDTSYDAVVDAERTFQGTQETMTLTIRISRTLGDRLAEMADGMDRSRNWTINQALMLYADPYPRPGHQFPPSELGGLARFQVLLQWYMPHFGSGTWENEDGTVGGTVTGTEEVIEDMFPALVEVMRSFGAQDMIDFVAPSHCTPMMHLTGFRSYPPGTDSPHDAN